MQISIYSSMLSVSCHFVFGDVYSQAHCRVVCHKYIIYEMVEIGWNCGIWGFYYARAASTLVFSRQLHALLLPLYLVEHELQNCTKQQREIKFTYLTHSFTFTSTFISRMKTVGIECSKDWRSSGSLIFCEFFLIWSFSRMRNSCSPLCFAHCPVCSLRCWILKTSVSKMV